MRIWLFQPWQGTRRVTVVALCNTLGFVLRMDQDGDGLGRAGSIVVVRHLAGGARFKSAAQEG